MSIFLGIDFGSSACRTAVLRGDAVEVIDNPFCKGIKPRFLTSSMGFGLPKSPLPVAVRSLKQELSNLQLEKSATGAYSRISENIGEALRQIRADLANNINESIAGTVLGIPGCYPDFPRSVFREAAYNAGFSAIRLINEGLAAALGATRPQTRGTTLVYAFGAGVFSATVVVFENGRPKVVSSEGDRNLGGAYLDTSLASLIITRLGFGLDFADPHVSTVYLKDLAENVKINLSEREEDNFDVNLTKLYGTGGIVRLTIKRSEFEEAISQQVDLTFDLTRMAVKDAALSQLDSIIMVGDSTCIPLIERRMSAEYSVQQIRAGNDDIARGAAWFGGQIEDTNWNRRELTSSAPTQAVPSASPHLTSQPPTSRGQNSSTWINMFTPPLLEAEEKWNTGDRTGAIRTFEVFLNEARSYLGTLYHSQGQEFFRDENYEEAVDVLKKAVAYTSEGDDRRRVMKNYHESLNCRARQLALNGRWEEARNTIRIALDINPDCAGCKQLYDKICQAIRGQGSGVSKKGKRK